jgi:hypothetical protein
MTDIVGPRNHGPVKPYGIWIDFQPDAVQPHPLTRGLGLIRLRNVQTVVVEPGGVEWLQVGEHAVYRPTGAQICYRDGLLSTPAGAEFIVQTEAAAVAVGADAPTGLTSLGAVRFLGTWDLLVSPAPDTTLSFVERLLNWLAGANEQATFN